MSTLREKADIVIDLHGKITEGIPGAHGKHRIQYPPVLDAIDLIAHMSTLYLGGIRTILLTESGPISRAFLSDRVIDEAVIDIPRDQIDNKGGFLRDVRLPNSFRIREVIPAISAVRIVARFTT